MQRSGTEHVELGLGKEVQERKVKKLKNPKTIAALKKIAARNRGVLLPEDVVAAAEPESSPLHKYFTWNTDEAAAKCRLQEARSLINVCVEYVGTENHGRETRVFVSLKHDRIQGGYRPLVTVLKSPSMREQLLQDSLEEMSFFREKYKSLRELTMVFKVMTATEKRLLK